MFGYKTNMDIYAKIQQCKNTPISLALYLVVKSSYSGELTVDQINKLKRFSKAFHSNIRRRMLKCNQNEDLFREMHQDWLNSDILWPDYIRDAFEIATSSVTVIEFTREDSEPTETPTPSKDVTLDEMSKEYFDRLKPEGHQHLNPYDVKNVLHCIAEE